MGVVLRWNLTLSRFLSFLCVEAFERAYANFIKLLWILFEVPLTPGNIPNFVAPYEKVLKTPITHS